MKGNRTIAKLLFIQPQSIKKNPDFQQLVKILNDSAKLRKVILPPKAWKLLNEPRLEIKYLDNFIRTYYLPEKGFFKLFLELKWSYQAYRVKRNLSRQQRISIKTETWPENIKKIIFELLNAEINCNENTPVYKKVLFPATMKRADELSVFSADEWAGIILKYYDSLADSYRTIRLPEKAAFRNSIKSYVSSFMRDECKNITAENKREYRKLLKKYHPDLGGDENIFIAVKRRYDELK